MNKQNPELRPASLDDARRHMYTSAIIPGLVMAVDIMAIVLSGVATYLAYVYFNAYVLEYYVFAISFVAATTLMLFNRAELYQISAIMRPVARSDSMLAAVITAFLFFLTIAFSLKASEIYSRIWLYGFAGASFVSVVLCRMLLYRIFRAMSRHGMIGRTMVVLGSGEQAVRFLEQLDRVKPYFTSVLGVYDPDYRRLGAEMAGQPVLGGIEELIAAARHAKIDDVVVALPWNADGQVVHAVERLKELPVNVYISSDLVGFQLAFRPALGHFQQLPLFEVVQRPISGWSSVIKTIEDYVLASLALILLSPLLILVAIAIKLDSQGPVFFMQPRLGFNNRHFEIYKFRSMYHREIPERRVRQASRRRSARHPGRALHPAHLDRRAAAASERAERHHVAGRPAAARAQPQRGVLRAGARLFRPPQGQARHHRLGPGQRLSRRDRHGREDQGARRARRLLRRELVAALRHAHPADDGLRRALPEDGVLKGCRASSSRELPAPIRSGTRKRVGHIRPSPGAARKSGAADRTAKLLGEIAEEPLAERENDRGTARRRRSPARARRRGRPPWRRAAGSRRGRARRAARAA